MQQEQKQRSETLTKVNSICRELEKEYGLGYWESLTKVDRSLTRDLTEDWDSSVAVIIEDDVYFCQYDEQANTFEPEFIGRKHELIMYASKETSHLTSDLRCDFVREMNHSLEVVRVLDSEIQKEKKSPCSFLNESRPLRRLWIDTAWEIRAGGNN